MGLFLFHLKIDSKISVIKFNANETNKINKNSYKNIFKPYLLKNIPNLSFNNLPKLPVPQPMSNAIVKEEDSIKAAKINHKNNLR